MFTEQDDFEEVLKKYNIWEAPEFDPPSAVDQEELYNQMLDECADPDEQRVLEKWNLSYSEMLEREDPIAYRCGFSDYADTLREEYFEGPGEEFYDPEEMRDAINDYLGNLVEFDCPKCSADSWTDYYENMPSAQACPDCGFEEIEPEAVDTI